jgi:OmpA-OmpF porin, OOP family
MSLINDLIGTFDQRWVSGVASTLGESDHTISRGFQSAAATVLGGLANRSDNPSFLRGILDMAPSGLSGITPQTLTNSITDSNSGLMSAGRNILSTLFGSSEGVLNRALSNGTGLQAGITSTLMTMAAPMIVGFLGHKMRDEGMSTTGLGNLLQRELPAIQGMLPAGVADCLWPRAHQMASTAAAAGPTVVEEGPSRSSFPWLPVILLLGLIPALWWFSRAHKPDVQLPSMPAGAANRMAPEPTANLPKVFVPSSIDLYFQTGSNRLRPDSYAKLQEFAAVLPAANEVLVYGYTDNVGSATSNLRLSQARADAVKANLIHKGIGADRLSAKGFGEENPIGDNSTAAGRDSNRRVTVEVANH